MKKFILLLILISFTELYAQKEDYVWHIPVQTGLSFNQNDTCPKPPCPFYRAPDVPAGTFATICGREGNMLFFTNGMKVWNRDYELMENGVLFENGEICSEQALIVKNPQNKTKYFIFHLYKQNEDALPMLYYSIVDISLAEGLGAVTEVKNVLLSGGLSENLKAALHANGKDVWILTHEKDTDAFLIYLLTKNGINEAPLRISAGPVLSYDENEVHHRMVLSQCTRILSLGTSKDTNCLFAFDNETGNIELIKKIEVKTLNKSSEFSPDGRRFYYEGDFFEMYQRSMFYLTGRPDIEAVSYLPIHLTDNRSEFILGPDNFLYAEEAYTGNRFINQLHVLEAPNHHVSTGRPQARKIYFYNNNRDIFYPNTWHMYPYFETCEGEPAEELFAVPDNAENIKYFFKIIYPESGINTGLSINNAPLNTDTRYETEKMPAYELNTLRFSNLYSYSCRMTAGTKYELNGNEYADSSVYNVTIMPKVKNRIIHTPSAHFCKGEEITLTVPENPEAELFLYKWYKDGEFFKEDTLNYINIDEPGIYGVEIHNIYGCPGYAEIETFYADKPEVSIEGNPYICGDTPAFLRAVPFYADWTYTWSNGKDSAAVFVNEPGIYELYCANKYGCKDTARIEVLNGIKPDAVIGFRENKEIICPGDSAVMYVNVRPEGENYSFLWQDGSQADTIVVKDTILYSCIVSHEQGCSDTISWKMRFFPKPEAGINASELKFCKGGSAALKAEPDNMIYIWNTGETSQEIIVKDAGNYSVIVENDYGCRDTAQVEISVYDHPEVEISGSKIICPGDSVLLTAVGDLESFLWSTGDTARSIYAKAPGEYTVQAIDAYGCSGRDTFMLEGFDISNLPELSTIDFGTIICSSDSSYTIDFNNTSGYTLKISRIILKNNTPEFNVDSDKALPLLLSPSENMKIELKFDASAPGFYSDSVIIIIEEPCFSEISFEIRGRCLDDEEKDVVFVWIPDIISKPGKDECIPVNIKIEKGLSSLNFDYNAEIRFDAQAFYPDAVNAGSILNKQRIIKLSGNIGINPGENKKIADICGITLLAENSIYPLIIEKFDILDTNIIAKKKNGLLEIGGICVYPLRGVKEFETLKMHLNPNPAGEKLNVNILSEEKGKFELGIYSITGNELKSFKWTANGKQEYIKEINLKDFSSGVYFAVLKSPWNVVSRKFVVVRE